MLKKLQVTGVQNGRLVSFQAATLYKKIIPTSSTLRETERIPKLDHKFGDHGVFWIAYEDLLSKVLSVPANKIILR